MEDSLSKAVLDIISSFDGVNIGSEQVDFDKQLINYGVDSITFIKIIVKIENEFKIEIDDSVLNRNSLLTIRNIVKYLKNKVHEGRI
ncbi:acyl carrier protein [Bacillus subtilis]|uniref:acyl carrier protein n=1 Tax=Bacillus TaxID=1386 RepID=UPI0002597C61|nr:MULTISPECIES: acyl carrier protein [Bacillus]QQF64480.1 acyl carrier protein [Bacillus mojavensis]AFI27215.1 Phosphopantetheine-binding protein [Bacillus sp. JS]MBO3637052.1 acyl carrier protein [Bacillus subtilis]MCV2517493.1 acyl carrier protein [Bacillus subtilis]QHJ99346.1 D-alanine--poly(phosphoribitol) ligase subunit 2 [Bacillus subtilis]